jgi:small multidrug resistance pump
MNPWIILILAILLEVSGTICLKLSHGMTRPLPILGVIVFYLSTFTLMSFCLKTLEVGTVYAIWSAVGTALIATVGILFFSESFTWIKMAGLGLVITGVILLRVSSNGG